MRRPPVRLALLALLVVPAALALPTQADMDEALALAGLGRAALEDGKPGEAVDLFRRALEEEAGCVPARLGLGEALLEADDVSGAVVAFREVVRATGPDALVPAAWKELGAEARKHLAEHDARGAELEELVDEHVKQVLRIAVSCRRKDPDLADRALAIVLALRPDHERALELRDELSRRGARREAIFDGKQIDDWDGGRGQWWKVEDGVIVGDTKGVATYVRNQQEIRGDFDVVMEGRIVKAYDDAAFLAVMGAWKAEYDHSRLGTLSGALTWYEHRGEDEKERVFRSEASRLKRPYDPSEWTTYELRYRGDVITACVNGREVHTIPRPKGRDAGYVGILAQECRAEIRRLDVLYR